MSCPKLIVFDLDYTLWPFCCEHVIPPFQRINDRTIEDRMRQKVKYDPHVTEILRNLNEHGYILAVASRACDLESANQLLDLFGWQKYFTYKEIHPGCKVAHFKKIQEQSSFQYSEMLFFDDEYRNISDLTKVGVTSILVDNVINSKMIQNGLQVFEKQHSK